LVLDYIEGGSLEELVDRSALRQERLPPPILLRIALDALAGLEAAHEATDAQGRALGILHRDISLQNILIGRDGVARVTDFGIAKSVVNSVQTDKEYVVGKLLYLAPEYLRRQSLTPTVDIYALGMTMWMALTGAEPWPDSTEAELVYHILEDRLPPLSRHIQIAPVIEQIIAKACDRSAAARFQSAREMAAAIESLGFETGWIATRTDVAHCIERLLGVDLQRRRERLAPLLDRPSPAAYVTTSSAAADKARVHDPSQVTLDHPARNDARVGWLPLSLAAVGVLVALTIAVAAMLLQKTSGEPDATDRAAGASMTEGFIARDPTRPAEPLVVPADAVPTGGVEPAASIPPTASTPAPPRSPRKRAPPRDPEDTTETPVRAPDDISNRNPYR
jgi:serine/threonine-protein kinase